MKPETIQRLLNASDGLAQKMGSMISEESMTYEEMAAAVRKWTPVGRFVLDFFEIMGTRTQMVDRLSKAEEPESNYVDFLVRSIDSLPEIFATGMREAVKSDALPPMHKGRPAMDPKMRYQIYVFVHDIHINKGLRESIAKKRAAQHFQVSLRSVHRVWNDRVQILEDSRMGKEILARFWEIMRNAATHDKEGQRVQRDQATS